MCVQGRDKLLDLSINTYISHTQHPPTYTNLHLLWSLDLDVACSAAIQLHKQLVELPVMHNHLYLLLGGLGVWGSMSNDMPITQHR